METLDNYFKLQDEIFKYFGYVEDWRILPLVDSRDCYWTIIGGDRGNVRFHEQKEALEDEEGGGYYEHEIYTQRHLPKWVYRGEKYTMICVDTNTDGNQYLQIFSNDFEIV